MRSLVRSLPVSLLLSTVISSVAAAAEVGKPVELAFTGSGGGNPYVDVTMYADFSGPGGAQLRVYAFWDGGDTWRLRFAAPAAGDWLYTTTATGDAKLHGLSGSVTADAGNAVGFIERNAYHPQSFFRAGSGSVFLMGDTNWRAMSDVGGQFPLASFRAYVDQRQTQGFNFIRSYLVPLDEPGAPSNANEGGAAFEPWDPDRLNPAYFAAADQRIQYAIDHGIAPALLFAGDERKPTDFFGWDNGKLERYVRYCVARYGAYDVLWELRAEFEDQGSPAPNATSVANQLGKWTQTFDPFHHSRSIHTTDSNNELADQTWLDWLMHQGYPGSTNGYAWDWVSSDRQHGKPVMNEEFYYENSGAGATHAHHLDADTVRKGAWHVMTAGAAGLAYGNTGTYNSKSKPFVGMQYVSSTGAAYMTHLASFWNKTRFARLSPGAEPDLVRAPGEEYVAYFETGGTRSLGIEAGSYSLSWYNPRTGTEQGSSSLTAPGGAQDFTAPSSEDWALHVVRDVVAPTPATVLGPLLAVAQGTDPDVAVATDKSLHVVYVRGGKTYYSRGKLDGTFEPELLVGTGVDPRIALDAAESPQVVLGASNAGGATVTHARMASGVFQTQTVVSGGQNRKPRIEVDSKGNGYVSYEDRGLATDRVRYVRVTPNGTTSSPTVVGADNNGGLAVDGSDELHFTFRDGGNVQHVTSTAPGNVGTADVALSGTSDFSELEYSAKDDSLHVVAEQAGGTGILYTVFRAGSWSDPVLFAQAQVTGVDDPDNVNPAIAVDETGRVFVTFAGIERVPYYSVIDATNTQSPVLLLAPGGGVTGGKYENPNVEEVPEGGAVAVWGSAGHVYLRTIGIEQPTGSGGSAGAGGQGSGGSAGAGGAPDAGAGAGGAATTSRDEGGCGCTIPGRTTDAGWASLLMAAALLGGRRRRALARRWRG